MIITNKTTIEIPPQLINFWLCMGISEEIIESIVNGGDENGNRPCNSEKDNEFLEALQSFQMMYNARIIIIYESTNEVVEFAEALKSIKSVKPMILTYIPNPYYGSLFSTTIASKPVVIKPVKSMLDF